MKKSSFLLENTIYIIISTVIMSALAAVLDIAEVPTTEMIMMTGLMIFTTLFGYGAGIAATAVIIVNSLFFSEASHTIFHHDLEGLQYIAIVFLIAILNVIFIGHLRHKQKETYNALKEANKSLLKINVKLHKSSNTDPLTGLKNRAALKEELIMYENCYLHVMMLDLDNFKTANDSMGHEAGDKILITVGKALTDVFGSESCYRYGGDEFLIICQEIRESHFALMINDLKYKLGKLTGSTALSDIFFSAGYVYGESELSKDIPLMIRMADSNLYKAKKAGKNGIVGSEYSRKAAESKLNFLSFDDSDYFEKKHI